MGSFLGSFDNRQVVVLQNTFDRVCEELGVVAEDDKGRSRIAEAVIALAKAGQLDPDRLRVYAVSRFRASQNEETV